MNKIEILEPLIFNNLPIIAGVTQSNFENFTPLGFSIGNHQVFGDSIIKEYRNYFANQFKVNSETQLIYQKQIHSDIIRIVDNEYVVGDSDAMITKLKDKILNISIADCCGILLYDPIREVIAGVHSGWKGTSLNITNKTIELMKINFQCNPKRIKAFMSPCASVENYEVTQEFKEYFDERYFISKDDKLYFDNKLAIKDQLFNSGLLINNIEISPICTIDDSNYHSFRRDKGNSGRMSAFIGMIE